MIAMLLAYDLAMNVVATLDYMVARDDAENAVGLIDFAAHEAAGGAMTDVWQAGGASGSKVWPEWLGAAAHGFRVELVGPAGSKRIGALIHKASGFRRERALIEKAIDDRIKAKVGDGPVDIRDLVGGPSAPLQLDAGGKTKPKLPKTTSTLPLVKVKP